MSCNYCGHSQCQGSCRLQMAAAQQNIQNQLGSQNYALSQAQQGLQAQYQLLQNYQMSSSIIDTYTKEFLNLIDGKSDEQIAVAFAEKQQAEIAKFKLLIETQQKTFLDMCKRFRPSIDEKLMERVSKLKAFW